MIPHFKTHFSRTMEAYREARHMGKAAYFPSLEEAYAYYASQPARKSLVVFQWEGENSCPAPHPFVVIRSDETKLLVGDGANWVEPF